MPRKVRFTEAEVRSAVAASWSCSEVLRRLGMRPAGGNHATLRKYLTRWQISTEHFDPHRTLRAGGPRSRRARPLGDVLVERSTYSRTMLKKRLFDSGLKARACERCGQGETWRGRRLGLLLGHVNGVADDHRLENLLILCPNCAATAA